MQIGGKHVYFDSDKEDAIVKTMLPYHVQIILKESIYDSAYIWCQTNNSSLFSCIWESTGNECKFYFESKNDAIIFKLTWAGVITNEIDYD